MRVRAMLLAACCLTAGLVATTTSPAGAITTPVDIQVTLTLDGETRQFENTEVVPEAAGDPELNVTHLTVDGGFCGAIEVDIDPDADTITLIAAENCEVNEIVVTIDTIEPALTYALVSDNAVNGADPAALSVVNGDLTVTWLPADGQTFIAPDLPDVGPPGMTVISYAYALPAASLAPDTVEAGEPVTVEGTLCPSGPIMATISPEGGDPIVDDEQMTVADDESGAWTFDIDTTGLAPGTYTVDVRCVQADLGGFPYDVMSFTVTAPGTTPTPTPTPADPVPANPTFTG